MKTNVGHPDRLIRAMLALIFLAFGIGGVLSGTLAIVSTVIGAILGLTALFAFCPIYTIAKKDTLDMGN